MHVYIVAHLGVDEAEAARLRPAYWVRYGATLIGLMRQHGVKASHFLEETHRYPGLEARVRTSPHDRAALRRLRGRKFVLTYAPLAYALRVLAKHKLARQFDGAIAIDAMKMFGHLRPKPDARMLRE